MRLLISGFAETVAWSVAGLLFAAGMGLVAVRLQLSPPIFWAVVFASFLVVFGLGLSRVICRGRRRAWGGYTFVGLAAATLAGLIFTFAFKGPTASLKSDDSLGLHFDRMPLPDGSQLAYRQYEPASDVPSPLPPIIILHGGPGVPPLKSAFDFYGRLTASGRKVYAYEQIGVGQSSKLARIEDYTLQRDVEDLDRFRQAIGAPKVVLVGQSWGTILAAHYIAQHSQAVERVVFISPAAFRQDEHFRSDPGPTARADSSAASPAPPRLFFVEMLAKLAPGAALMLGRQEEIGHDYDLLWADSAFADILSCRGTQPGPETLERANGANYFALMMTLRSMVQAKDPVGVLKTMKLPVLLLRGECDFQPAAIIEDYRSIFSNAQEKTIEGAGHAVVETQPAASAKAILQFMAETLIAPVDSAQGTVK